LILVIHLISRRRYTLKMRNLWLNQKLDQAVQSRRLRAGLKYHTVEGIENDQNEEQHLVNRLVATMYLDFASQLSYSGKDKGRGVQMRKMFSHLVSQDAQRTNDVS
jgi:hypothetical protein